jgi:quercetin dioxygenase-like cupin family protein
VDILRFGPGFREPYPPPGSLGLAEKAIWGDRRARITELSFARRALLPPVSSSDDGLLIVVAGGGWVQVGAERSPIHHGEAVEWPAGVSHAAWTDGSPMRALLVEVPVAPGEGRIELLDGRVVPDSPVGTHAARGELAADQARPEDHDPAEGEPW